MPGTSPLTAVGIGYFDEVEVDSGSVVKIQDHPTRHHVIGEQPFGCGRSEVCYVVDADRMRAVDCNNRQVFFTAKTGWILF